MDTVKFAFSSNAFRKYTLRETIEVLASIGYEGVEIMADVPHAYPKDLTPEDVIGLRRLLEKHGMQVSNVNAFTLHAEGDTWHPSWIDPDREKRRQRINHTLACVDLAWRLGAATISTEPGGPLDGMDRLRASALFREGLSVVGKRARTLGLRVLIEPEPGLMLETSTEFMDFYRDLDPEVFGLNFDIGHFFCVGEDPASLVELLKHCTFHYHLEDIPATREHVHTALGRGALDIPSVLRALESSGYEGFVTVELYPYQDNPAEVARDALAYLKALSG